MKISLNWLKYYVDINVSIDELCDKMIMSGFEVEGIENLADKMKNVVVAKITNIVPHPDSDHLQICTMDVGDGKDTIIVTGAQNVFTGALVPAALNDSYLPNGMHIKTGKLRGVESCGMLCSGEELGITDSDYPGASVNGILILKDDLKIGTDMREVLKMNDCIIDFKITANRPDCNCVLGVAKEIAVALKQPFKSPEPKFNTVGDDINAYIKIDVKNFDLCPRYMGRIVKNIRIKESPDWMKQCIKAAGMRPINNIVDITNFVMLETGQPMHAFDLRDIAKNRIIVRNAEQGEKITTLDGNEHELSSEMLVIADGDKPSCIAGVMGGLNSEIKDDTTEILFESAKFRRDSVRKTSRAIGLRTESSGRFERGIDINNTEFAMNRALQLISDLDAGDIVDGVIDLNEGLPSPKTIVCDYRDILALLGVDIPVDTMVDILNALDLKTVKDGYTFTTVVPTIRDDVEGKADLAEEIMRVYGYDHIIGKPMNGIVRRGRVLEDRAKKDNIKKVLVENGMYEISTYSFISSKETSLLKLSDDDYRMNGIRILNPLGDEYSVMRTQLITSMLRVVSTNYNRKNADARLFEIDKRFIPKSLPITVQPDEKATLCFAVYGENEDFFTAKGIVEDIIDAAGGKMFVERSNEPYFHPGRQADIIVNGKKAGTFGQIHPKVAESFDIDCDVYVCELMLDLILEINKKKTIYKPLPKFPAVTRDFAMLCDKALPVGNIEKAIKSGAGKLCQSITLFDIYEGSQIPENKKSVAYSVVLRSDTATLTDEEIDKVSKNIIQNLEKIGAELRK